MEPVVRILSPHAAPLVQRLIRTPEPQSSPATQDDIHRVAAEFIQLAAEKHTTPTSELPAVVDVLARTLLAVGELDLTDVDAVRLGPQDYARRLRGAVPGADRGLSPDAAWFHDALLVNVCLHVLDHFIGRSPHIQQRMPERASRIRQLVDLNDTEAAARHPERSHQDADFEVRYAEEVVRQHGWLTIVGVDFPNAPDRWLLEDTYLSLEAEESTGDGSAGGQRTVLLADRALEGHERVLLRGVAGSGKTTLVQWLAVATAREGARVPFVLPVRRFAREGFPARTTSCGPSATRSPTRRRRGGSYGRCSRAVPCCWSTGSTRLRRRRAASCATSSAVCCACSPGTAAWSPRAPPPWRTAGSRRSVSRRRASRSCRSRRCPGTR